MLFILNDQISIKGTQQQFSDLKWLLREDTHKNKMWLEHKEGWGVTPHLPLSKKTHFFSMIWKKWPEPHETQEKLITKIACYVQWCSISINRKRFKWFLLSICKYYILKIKIWLKVYEFLIHFRPFPSDKKNCKKKWFRRTLRSRGGGDPDLFLCVSSLMQNSIFLNW